MTWFYGTFYLYLTETAWRHRYLGKKKKKATNSMLKLDSRVCLKIRIKKKIKKRLRLLLLALKWMELQCKRMSEEFD